MTKRARLLATSCAALAAWSSQSLAQGFVSRIREAPAEASACADPATPRCPPHTGRDAHERGVFKALDAMAVLEHRQAWTVPLMAQALLDYRAANPSAAPGDLLLIAEAIRNEAAAVSELPARRWRVPFLEAAANAAGQRSSGAGGGGDLGEAISIAWRRRSAEWMLDVAWVSMSQVRSPESPVEMLRRGGHARSVGHAALAAGYALAEGDLGFRAAFNTLTREAIGADVELAPEAFRARVTAAFPGVALADWQALVGLAPAELRGRLNDATSRTGLASLNAIKAARLGGARSASAMNSAQDAAEAERAATDALVATVGLLSAAGEFGAAREAERVGGAAIAVWSTVQRFSPALDATSRTTQVLGAAAMTMNVAGIVIGLIAASQPSGGPSVEEFTLAQIGELRQQVADLAQEMRDNFGYLDRRLDGMTELMVQAFGRLEDGLRGTGEALELVRRDLVRLQAGIDVLGQDLRAYFGEAIEHLSFNPAYCLGNLREHYQPDRDRMRRLWDECALDLVHLLQSGLSGEVAAGRPLSHYGVGAAAIEKAVEHLDFGSYDKPLPGRSSLAREINLLRDLAGMFEVPDLPVDDLPNPERWAQHAKHFLITPFPQLSRYGTNHEH